MTDYLRPTSNDLATYLGSPVDQDRADLLIEIAETDAKLIADPLPEVARGKILSAVARAYSNPAQTTQELAGPFSAARPFPGVFFTKSERKAIRAAAGHGSGAFTINPISPDRDTDLFPWDVNQPDRWQYDEYSEL